MPVTWVQFLSWGDPVENKMVTHSNVLAWKIPWTEVSSGATVQGCHKKVRHNLATKQQRLCEVTQRIMRTFREFYSKASKLQPSQSLSEAHSWEKCSVAGQLGTSVTALLFRLGLMVDRLSHAWLAESNENNDMIPKKQDPGIYVETESWSVVQLFATP